MATECSEHGNLVSTTQNGSHHASMSSVEISYQDDQLTTFADHHSNHSDESNSHGNQFNTSKEGSHDAILSPEVDEAGCHGNQDNQSEAAWLCAEALEKEHVHAVYEQTAHHFKDVRYRAWPKVRQFLSSLEPGALVADVGE